MHVFLAGGTGVMGRRLLPQLRAAGHTVTATTRTPEKQDLLWDLGARPVVVDGLDAGAVGRAVAAARPDAVVHQMTDLGELSDLRRFDRTFAGTNRLRSEGTDHLLAAARAAGVRRFVAASFTGWVNERTGGPVKSEDDPLDPAPVRSQRESMAAIRHLEDAVCAAPLEGVVLRYGMFYGPGASEPMISALRSRRMPVVGRGDGVWTMVHIDDAAAATVLALDRGRGLYNVVDDEPARVGDLLPELARAVGARPPRRIPTWLARVLAGEAPTVMLTEQRGSSNARAKQDLGWRPRWTWRTGFATDLPEGVAA